MNILKYLTIFGFIFYTFILNAQNNTIIKGTESYESYSYSECINKFEGISEKSYEIKKKLAESYYKTGDYINSQKYYSEIVQSEKSNSDDVYNYASVLKINKEYTEAEIWMEKFYMLEKTDSRAEQFMQNKNNFNTLLEDKKQFRIQNLDINTEHQDFGTSYYLDKIVFASSRTSSKLFKRVWNWNQLPFLDIFIADVEKSKLSDIKPFKKKFNNKYHEGPASFNKAGSFMAFTRNNYKEKSKDGVVNFQIFTSEKIDNKWQEAKSVHFNNNEYSVGHPSLTNDGNTMYFASNMPGGYGGVDIYLVEKNEAGDWGKPHNLGKTINTEGNEKFPFIHESGMLFFASDGLIGLGGLDMFYTKLNNNDYSNPKNIGIPVNSNNDDFALIIDHNMKRGFFSSNRENGKGNDDIYSFKLLKELTFDILIKGKTIDKNGNLLANTNVSLQDEKGNIIKIISSDENGNYSFEVSPDSEYVLSGSKPNYITGTSDVNTGANKKVYEQNLILDELPDFSLLCIITDKENSKPITGVKIISIDNTSNATDEFTSQKGGKFHIKLDDAELNDSISYTFILEKEGYVPKEITYEELLNTPREYICNIKMQKIEIGEDLGEILEIYPIYFDLDKYNIRHDASEELDKIVDIMNKYPNMEIELSSHTDCRATSIYNLKLSNRRAKASIHYIKTRITNPIRIYGQGFGETQLINDCRCESNIGKGMECSEEEHQQNRRTEFKIIKK